MNDLTATWNDVVETATKGLGASAARRRRMWARQFAQWCERRDLDPRMADQEVLGAFLDTLSAGAEMTRGRSELRALIELVDPERAARALGIGDRSAILAATEGTPLGELVRVVVEQFPQPIRQRVRKSALVRLFVWAEEVGVPVINLKAADLDQFGRWVQDVGSTSLEIKVVAKDFIGLRHSPEGRRILGEPEPAPAELKLELAAPLRPRFELSESLP